MQAKDDNLCGDKLRCVRPGVSDAMHECASSDDIGFYYDVAQGELGAIEADEGALDWDELEEDGAAPRVAKDIYIPTARDMEEHCATHIPAKDWCPACVEGELSNPSHKRTVDGDKTVPEV